MITTRLATTDDLDWIVGEVPALNLVFGSRRSLAPSADSVAAIVAGWIAQPEATPVFLALRDGVPVGFLVGHLAAHPYNPDIETLSTMLLWVAPSARGTRALHEMLAAYEAFGQSRADWIVFACNASSLLSPRSLGKRGYRLCEVAYLKEVA